MSFIQQIALLNQKIGPAGFALIFLGIAGLYFTIRNTAYLWLVGRDFNRITSLFNNDPDNMPELVNANKDNPIVSILNDLISTHGQHSADLKAEVAYLFYRQFSKVIRDVTMIRVIAVISPLLGLLGTLLGLLGVFKTLSSATAAATSTLLASGIWEAILTTIMGLTLAIPALVVYYVLNLYMRSFSLAAVEYGYRLFDCGPVCRPKNNTAG